MRERSFKGSRGGDSPASERRFRHALIAYAVVEFVALAFVVWYRAAR